MSITQQYAVDGMTCQHCVTAVRTEVATLAGVTEVQVDLGNGRLVVVSDREIPFPVLAAAVDEAGYTVRAA